MNIHQVKEFLSSLIDALLCALPFNASFKSSSGLTVYAKA